MNKNFKDNLGFVLIMVIMSIAIIILFVFLAIGFKNMPEIEKEVITTYHEGEVIDLLYEAPYRYSEDVYVGSGGFYGSVPIYKSESFIEPEKFKVKIKCTLHNHIETFEVEEEKFYSYKEGMKLSWNTYETRSRRSDG